MNARVFVDTNVVVYLFDDDAPAKQAIARTLFADPALALVLSTQVLAEFYVVATRKLARPLTPDLASDVVDDLSDLDVVPTDAAMVRSAIATSRAHQVSLWDALVVEAAAIGGAESLLTEDFQDGAVFRGVTVRNPFAGVT